MATSNITVRDLIIGSIEEVGAYDFGAVLPEADIFSALYRLNSLFDSFEGEPYCIPYYTVVSFNLVPGKNIYRIGLSDEADVYGRKIVDIQSARIKINNLWQPIKYLDQAYYDTSTILDQNYTRPIYIFLQNTVYDSEVTLYPVPNLDYLCEIKCKQLLDELELDDRLDEIPASMFDYLHYELARRLAPSYSTGLSADQKDMLKEAKRKLKRMSNKSPLAITVSKGARLTGYQRGDRGY